MEKRLVTRYATKSAEAADETQRRVEAVFDELAAAEPDNVSYIVLRGRCGDCLSAATAPAAAAR